MIKSRQTTYDRGTPEHRKQMRQISILVPCTDCGAKVGERCRGCGGGVAKPHVCRQIAGKSRAMTPKRNDALQVQEGGDHYKSMAIQPVEFITRNNLPFLEGCVVKRVCRHRSKNGAEDIRKAIHELRLILQLEYNE